jgi:hypothetical protein
MKRPFCATLAFLVPVLVVGCGKKAETPAKPGAAKPVAEAPPPTPVPPVNIVVEPNANVEAKTLKPGLKVTTFLNNKFTGPGETESVTSGIGFDCDRNPYMNKEMSLRYSGWMKIDKEGTYCFQVITDDQATFLLNGKAILNDFAGVKEQKVTLKPGYYELRFDWQNNIGPACLTVKWALGDCSGAAPIEASRYYH